MAQQLLSSFGRKGVDLHLNTMRVDIEDTSYLSKYFVVAEFNPVFTAGRNVIAFDGSKLLKSSTEIQVQCIDSNGNSLYLEQPKSKNRYIDVANFLVSIHVYDETYNGPGQLILVGKTKKNEVVRWKANITIDKTLQNVSKARFYNTPTMEARSLLYPVIANAAASTMTNTINFMGNFTAYAVTPQVDTLQSSVVPKKTDIDYRLVYSYTDPIRVGPQIYPTESFNTQMEGQTIDVKTRIIREPFSYRNLEINDAITFTIKKVIDSKTIILSEPFYYMPGKDNIVTNINQGYFTSSYSWVAYNTSSDIYGTYRNAQGGTSYFKESYAEIVYRNIKPFSGFIARHKLYRKSLLYPGDFELIEDGTLGTRDLLVDPVTANKSYASIGKFYNQVHINKYWYTGSAILKLSHSVAPFIDGMNMGLTFGNFDIVAGNFYIIVKTDSIDSGSSDNIYYPYNEAQFNSLSGSSYNSNFIDLKEDSLYVLSMNLAMEKNATATDAKLTFYFTSSIPSMRTEADFNSRYGLKLGEIALSELVSTKIFPDKQYIYFTPQNDYYGTLVIVPYKCTATFSDMTLGVYGDYGFSPDNMTVKVPFPIHVPNEVFQLKAELFDINSTLIFSNLSTVQSFDQQGESLPEYIAGGNLDPSNVDFISGSLTISGSNLWLPNLENCGPADKRLLMWKYPGGYPPSMTDGGVCWTDVTDVKLDAPQTHSATAQTKDYITVATKEVVGVNYVEFKGSSLCAEYDGVNSGIRIKVNPAGAKTTES